MEYIEIENLSYSYPLEGKKSLNNINLGLGRGEVLLVVGKSGSGKSTLAKSITGAVPHFYGGTISGGIIIDGVPLEGMNHSERAKTVTMVFQDPEKQLMMNKVHREIAFGLENIGVSESTIKRRVWEVMEFIGITDLAERDITTLSGGQKQKVAIASAVAYLPKCIIFDEPSSQLDVSAAESIVNLIRKINEELGITIIIIEQRVNKWFDIADKIAFMNEGKVNFYNSRYDFYKESKEEVINFLPDYLKLSKNLSWGNMPNNFKETRCRIDDKYSDISIDCLDFKIDKNHVKKQVCEYGSNAIKTEKLNCYFNSIHAIKDLSLNIENGDFIGIMGANGAGKSTLLNSLIGLKEYKGSIKVFGNEVKKLTVNKMASIIGYVSQNPNDYISKSTVYEELKFTMDNYNSFDKEELEKVLKDLDIYELKDKNPRDLSGGQKQRVAIGSILVMKPKILLIDEPTRGLDLEVKNKLGRVLKNLNNNGTTIVMVTHDVDFACDFCKSFALMFNGEIVSKGSRYEVLSHGIYYTTSINKLFKNVNEKIFTLDEGKKYLLKEGQANEKN
ncbi:energy-coupling factor transporter ATPase [Clostridium sp. UBA3887]|uniref:ABC transporter ATP-binding protein n=1 Tax=Clostridium sp. UBA3887 TaxID=1946356 RepID=UPI0032172644